MKRRAYLRFINEAQSLPPPPMGADEAAVAAWAGSAEVEWTVYPAVPALQCRGQCMVGESRQALERVDPGLFELELVWILGGAYCYLTSVNIPSRQTRHIHQALPFMLEDQLSEDVEQFQFVPGSRNSDGRVPVLTVARTVIDSLATVFRRLDLPVDAVVPDMLCLPCPEGTWTVLCDERVLCVRTGDMAGIAIESDALPVVGAALVREGSTVPPVINAVFAHRQLSDSLQSWLRTQFATMTAGSNTELKIELAPAGRFEYLVQSIATQSRLPPNLLVGDQKAMPRRRQGTLRWRPTAAIAALCALLHTTYVYAETLQLRNRSQQANTEAVTLYKRYFPQDRVIRDPKRQMSAHLQRIELQGAGASFMSLLAATGQVLNGINRGSQPSPIELQRVSYDEAQSDVKLDLRARGYPSLEDFKSRLDREMLGVEVLSASQEGEQVKARVRVWSKV